MVGSDDIFLLGFLPIFRGEKAVAVLGSVKIIFHLFTPGFSEAKFTINEDIVLLIGGTKRLSLWMDPMDVSDPRNQRMIPSELQLISQKQCLECSSLHKLQPIFQKLHFRFTIFDYSSVVSSNSSPFQWNRYLQRPSFPQIAASFPLVIFH